MRQWLSKACRTAATISPSMRALLTFLTPLALLIFILKVISYRDPSSFFFDAKHAYTPKYSAHRIEQAKNFLGAYPDAAYNPIWSPFHDASICLGVLSSPEAARDLPITLGSLLEGMGETERQRLHLKVMIRQTDPQKVTALQQPWLADLADSVFLHHRNISVQDTDHVQPLETGDFHDQATKRTFDFRLLLRDCLSTEAPYILMIEDGVVAADGWLQRTLAALEDIEKHIDGSFYLRLFFAESLIGWDFQNYWKTYVSCSLMIMAFIGSCLLSFRKLYSQGRRFVAPVTTLLVCFVGTPVLILLYFAAGRHAMMPMPQGIVDMQQQNYHGRAQGLAFMRRDATELMSWFNEHPEGDLEELVDQFAEMRRYTQFAMVPSVLQNMVSSGTGGDRPDWNFRFERFDAEELRREHERFRVSGWIKHAGLV